MLHFYVKSFDTNICKSWLSCSIKVICRTKIKANYIVIGGELYHRGGKIFFRNKVFYHLSALHLWDHFLTQAAHLIRLNSILLAILFFYGNIFIAISTSMTCMITKIQKAWVSKWTKLIDSCKTMKGLVITSTK